jgi:membrane protein
VDRRAIGSRRRRSVPLVALVRQVMREQTAEQVGLSASGAAFWLVIAVLPTAIAAVSIYGLVVSPQTVATNLAGLASNGPQSLGATLAQQLQKVAATDHGGLTAGLVISVVLALWSASAGIYNLERAIRAAYGYKPEEYVRARGRALVGAVVVVLSLGIVALISTAAAIVTDYLPVIVVVVIAVPLFVGGVTAVIATLYRYSVGHRLVLRGQLPGAVTASVGLGVVVGAFAVYLRFSTRYTAVYGALAGTVIGMIGTYLAVYVVLLGAVLNAQVANLRSTHTPAEDQVQRAAADVLALRAADLTPKDE